MDGFFQAAGGVLVAVFLILILSARDKSISSLLSMGVCAMVLLVMVSYLQPVIAFVEQLEALGNLQSDLVEILLKAGGIGILTEIAALLCADSGNASLAQSLRLLGSAVILWLALPVFQALIALFQRILEGL